jgi:hypothetical protein
MASILVRYFSTVIFVHKVHGLLINLKNGQTDVYVLKWELRGKQLCRVFKDIKIYIFDQI